jgi:predicted nucleotidyltransferase
MKGINFVKDIKARKILEKVDNKMIELFKDKLKNVILYGSYARNENTSESDIDVMVLVDETECRIREYEDNITDIMVELSLEYEIVVSIYTQSVEEYEKQAKVLPFLINVQKEGINVHG